MTPEVVVAIVVALFLFLVGSGSPIAFALILSALLGIGLVDGFAAIGTVAVSEIFSTSASYFLILIPLYVLMGMLVTNGGMAEDIYRVLSRSTRRFPGGLGVATIAACAGFAAVTGSSIATVATIGRVSIREMRARGYPVSLAAGIVAAGGTLGALIPPSVILVLYGVTSGESIGELLLAGILPGLLVAALYAAYVVYVGLRKLRDVVPEPFPAEPAHGGDRERAKRRDKALPMSSPYWRFAAGTMGQVGLLFTIVIGGMYSGLFTVVEAGAIGVGAGVVIVVVRVLRRHQGVWTLLTSSLTETVSTISMVFLLLVGGSLLSYFFVITRVPQQLSVWVTSLNVPPILVVIFILLLLVPLGGVLDALSLLLIVVPVAHPIVTELGYNGVWFAILFLRMTEIGLVTPPVGLNVYVAAGVLPDIRVEDVFRGTLPFIAMDVVSITILLAAPSIVTVLPSMSNL